MLNKQDDETFLSGIATETGLSHSTVSRVIEPLLEIGIVKETTLAKQIRVFRVNQESELTKYLNNVIKIRFTQPQVAKSGIIIQMSPESSPKLPRSPPPSQKVSP